MKKKIRCCMAFILPCGAGDHVEEIGHVVSTDNLMRVHPKQRLLEPTPMDSVDQNWPGNNEPRRPAVFHPRPTVYFLALVSSSTAPNELVA
ncbi:hypothetical protein HPP92_026987 [Vanilla planifolia]|uniref:Uncharacterized protein n=1 Tax=Vanilla planifolia TaxID=51239 RepID=A0A835PE54_VANPL|nr:hypothetical protein HPP92_027130 [Vanilla planifolia]KAG0450017.1 hypothetical protein HPP92_026987 [Vanilla planifolia]